MNVKAIQIPRSVIIATLASLHDGGRRGCESVALWLGKREKMRISISEAYVPEHHASEDYFEMPRTSIAALFDRLRATQTFVAAQVHTHPRDAFHSSADDRWAIVRHVGAVSVVLPDFGLRTTVESFVFDSKVFVLSHENAWEQEEDSASLIEVLP